MQVNVEYSPDLAIVFPEGRLDAFGSKDAQASLSKALDSEPLGIIIDLEKVSYISSAGLRVLAKTHSALHNRGGLLILCSILPYNMEVLRLSGFLPLLRIVSDRAAAAKAFTQFLSERQILLGWQDFAKMAFPEVTFRVLPFNKENSPRARVLGSFAKVVQATIDEKSILPRLSRAEEYSVGIGGLGAGPKEVFPLLGEMMTVGGTVVWLPSDGNDTPDFLIPAAKQTPLTVQTAYQITVSGGWNESVVFTSTAPEGIALDDLYTHLFTLARRRSENYRGALGFVICGQTASMWGNGIKQAPIEKNKPANGEAISHPCNDSDWYERPETPHREEVTGLICGVAIDEAERRVGLDPQMLEAAFSHGTPGDVAEGRKTHAHGVFFSKQPLPERMVSIEREIQNVVEAGDFVDMRHLDGKTRLTRGLIGVSYLQEFLPDTSEV